MVAGSETGDGSFMGAAAIVRGVRRHLWAAGQSSIAEAMLPNGRRADVMALDSDGRFTIIEVKSSVADFRSDSKWPEYLPFCDRFGFAVDADFPADLIPDEVGLIVADSFDAAVVRPLAERPLAPARRRALLLRFAAMAAERLHRLEDPRLVDWEGGLGRI